ncbi:MAG: formate--tetrahydrofolate ligase, partial [Thermaerobacterales bacterium]
MTPSKSDVPDLRPIAEIAAAAGIPSDLLEPFGRYKAKINLGIFDQVADRPQGKLILVTSINPTPAGEGKTVTAIGLAQGLTRLGERTAVTLREPSMGPTFGMKGGATGGGLAS